MKTIFITSFNPFICRNILATDVFKNLRIQPDLRFVLFVPDYKVDYFRERFGASNVVIEGIKVEKISEQDVFFTYLASSLVDSNALALHKREKLLKDRNYPKFVFSWLFRKIFSRFAFVKRFARKWDSQTITAESLEQYFNAYIPALIFSTDVYHNDDVHFLAAAKRKKIFSVGMIRSWDNITTKGMFRIKPDKLIVHNKIIKREAMAYNDMQAENIFVSGVPQYDEYINGMRMSRQDFFQKIGLDSNKKLILFSPFGSRFFKYDWQILEILKELNTQVLVRLTPNDKVDLENFKSSPLFHIDQPGRQFKEDYFRDTELDEKDANWLADSIYHSDVVVVGGASLAVDAAVFNKPAVFGWFDGFEKLPYIKSARRWFDFDHCRRLWQSGGVGVGRNKEEFLDAIKLYLENPKFNEDRRRNMAMEQCWKLDGNSGKRIAEFLINYLK